MKRIPLYTCLVFCLAVLILPQYLSAQTEVLDYPEARVVDQTDTYHGVEVADPYRWMEDIESKEVLDWIKAQDALTRHFADATPIRADLEKRILALQTFDRYGMPIRKGNRYFWGRTKAGMVNPELYVQEGITGEARMIFNPQTHPHLQKKGARFGGASYSRDGQKMAYRIGQGQSRWRKLYIMQVDKGEDGPEELQGVLGGIAWDQASDGFFYVKYPVPEEGEEMNAALENAKIYYHRVGTLQEADPLIYERPQNPTWSYGVRVSDDGAYLVISATPGGSFSGMSDYLFYQDLKAYGSSVVQLFGDTDSTYGFEGNDGATFWIRTDHEAPNARLVAVNIEKPSPAHWTDLIPEEPEVLNTISIVGDYLIARYSRDARPVVKVFKQDGTFAYALELPNLGSANGLGDMPEANEAFYSMNILYDPGTVYRLDVETGKSTVFRRPALPYNPDAYAGKQVFVTSKDGTRVPMYIIHKKGIKQDGNNPLYMYAYGAYAWVAYPWFQPSLVSWLERGGVYALPNIRGGGEYGDHWHKDGIRANKQNAIDDYIAAAEWLIEHKYTNPERMIANGGSASGPLAAAAIIQRPALFGAGVIDIPNLDLLRAHLFPGGPNRVQEFGSSENVEEFEALRAYSPYHNVKDGVCYPPMILTVGSKDEVAFPSHGYKFVARMQEAQACDNPVLLNVAWGAGHSYGLNAEQNAETWSENLAFLIRVLGLENEFGKASVQHN